MMAMISKRIQGYYRISKFLGLTSLRGLQVLRESQHSQDALDNPEARQIFQQWAKEVCEIFEISIQVSGAPLMKDSGLLVGNHMSYFDIPVLCSVDPINFVSKKEVESWPIIGKVGKAIGNIFHDRENSSAGKETANALKESLLIHKRRVCVFPAGTTSLRGLPWRPGVFRLAHETGVPLQPFVISYRPFDRVVHETGSMLTHSVALNDDGPLQARIIFAEPFVVKDPVKDLERCFAWNEKTLNEELALVTT